MLLTSCIYSARKTESDTIVLPKREKTLSVTENYVSKPGKENGWLPIEITADDALTISNMLDSPLWQEGLSDCAHDCTINLKGIIYYYHSSCGSFEYVALSSVSSFSAIKPEIKGKTMTLNEEEKETINAILEKYITLGDTLELF